MFKRDRPLLGYKTINEHLYIYLALVLGRRNTECRHIANASTLTATSNFPKMQEEEFKRLLFLATEQAKQFALEYINNELPIENIYTIRLSQSCDDPKLTKFDLYPDDDGKVIETASVETLVETLLRKGKIPVWIDIAVTTVKQRKTVLTLLCAGRYSDNLKELYYHERGTGPFGVKSPNLPIGFKEGKKFWLPPSYP